MTGTVASLLFLFARIEGEARAIIAKVKGPECMSNVLGARATLLTWKDLILQDRERRPEEALLAEQLWAQMQGPIDVRNGICHGLVGASGEWDDNPGVLHWRAKDGAKSMTYAELQEMFAWLSKIPQALSMISHAVLTKDASTLRPLPERDFLASEFGICFD